MSEAHLHHVEEIRDRVPRLGVVGSCNLDLVVRCRELPKPGETVLGDDLTRLPGGKGANQAVAASHLGANVSLIACVGKDADGEWLIESLRTHGVRGDLIQRTSRSTGTALIAVDDHGENEIIVATGANNDLNITEVDLSEFDVVLSQLEVPSAVIDEAARRSSSFILNVAPSSPVSDETLKRCSVVIANEIEASYLDLDSLAHCVVTLGANGAVHYHFGHEVVRVLAPAVDPVDTVGAGDVFCAAYAIEMIKGSDPESALRFSVAAGALATLADGAQGSLPSNADVLELLSRTPRGSS
jgi:ribokinase